MTRAGSWLTGDYLATQQRGELDVDEPRVQEDVLFVVVADTAARVLLQQPLYQINGGLAVLELFWKLGVLLDDVVGHYVFGRIHEGRHSEQHLIAC